MSIDVFKLGRCLCPLGHRRAVGPSCIGPGPLLATGIRSQRQEGEPRTDLRAWGTERSFKPFTLNEIKDLELLVSSFGPRNEGKVWVFDKPKQKAGQQAPNLYSAAYRLV